MPAFKNDHTATLQNVVCSWTEHHIWKLERDKCNKLKEKCIYLKIHKYIFHPSAVVTQYRKHQTVCADFPTGVELADNTTALLTDWCGGVAHCHAYIRLLIFCVVTQQTTTFWGVGTQGWGLWPQIWTDKQTNRCRWKRPPRSAVLCRWVINKHQTAAKILRSQLYHWHNGTFIAQSKYKWQAALLNKLHNNNWFQ